MLHIIGMHRQFARRVRSDTLCNITLQHHCATRCNKLLPSIEMHRQFARRLQHYSATHCNTPLQHRTARHCHNIVPIIEMHRQFARRLRSESREEDRAAGMESSRKQ